MAIWFNDFHTSIVDSLLTRIPKHSAAFFQFFFNYLKFKYCEKATKFESIFHILFEIT